MTSKRYFSGAAVQPEEGLAASVEGWAGSRLQCHEPILFATRFADFFDGSA